MAASSKTAASSQSNTFIKQLVSSNRTTRDRALSSLRTYLSTPRAEPLSQLELLRLWKGLFYSMFMSDKPRNQQQLARDLAALPDVLRSEAEKLDFLGAFWKTMAKEWSNIDYLRVDKYLYLVRCYVGKGFGMLAERNWDEEFLEGYLEMLRADGGPLSARDVKVASGLKLHVLDVWVDELEKVDSAEGQQEENSAPLEKVMGPVRRLSKESFVKSVSQRAKETIGDTRLVDGKTWRQEEDEAVVDEEDQPATGEDVEFGGFDD